MKPDRIYFLANPYPDGYSQKHQVSLKPISKILKNSILIFLLLFISCKESEREKITNTNANRSITKKTISNKWYGTYSFALNEDSEDWRDAHYLSIVINKDSVLYSAEGYQLYHSYKLSAIENNNTLKLTFKKSYNNTDSWALEKTKDFGVLTLKNSTYIWKSPFIDTCFNDAKTKKYILKKI